MKNIETTADKYVRLLRKRHAAITSSPEKSKRFLESIGLEEQNRKDGHNKGLNIAHVKMM